MRFLAISALPLALSQSQNTEVDYKDVFHHACKKDGMYAYIKKDDLAKLGSWQNNFTHLTLNNQECGAVLKPQEKGDMIYFDAGSFKEEPLECDTQYTNHYGRMTFWNMIQYTPPDDSMITRDSEGLYNFSCTYNMTVTGQQFELSVGHKVKTSPFDSIKFAGQEGQGSFNASMELFQDETYSKERSYMGVSSGVTLTLEQYLYIQVKLQASDTDIALKLLECWATPSANAGNQIRHTLIKDGCKTDETVTILKSGIGQYANWKAQMFTFINEDEVWLHCDIQACNTKEEDCSQQVCEETVDAPFSVNGQGPSSNSDDGSRKKRSANVFTISQKRSKREVDDSNVVKNSQDYEPNILTTGPIVNSERRAIKKQKQVGPIIAIAVIGVLIALGMTIGIYRVLLLKRDETAKIVEAGNNNQITADWNLYSSNQEENKERINPMLVY